MFDKVNAFQQNSKADQNGIRFGSAMKHSRGRNTGSTLFLDAHFLNSYDDMVKSYPE